MSSTVEIDWVGDARFSAGRPGHPHVEIDSDGNTGPSPVDALLLALGSCVSVDVLEILAKRRTPARAYHVVVDAERMDGVPRRLKSVVLRFTIAGDGIERVHVERAITLAITKYCSVRDSLRQDIPVDWTLELDSSGAPRTE